MTPYKSDDLTTVIEQDGQAFVVLWSPETAEHEPDYCELDSFPTREQAEAYVTRGYCPESEIRFILRLAWERISDSKDTSKSKILVWVWFGSPLDERAATMKRTSEPPH